MRQFIATSPLDSSGLLSVSGKDYNYLKNVLRLKSGDMVSVRLPDGNLVDMTLCKIFPQSITLQLCSVLDGNHQNMPMFSKSLMAEMTLFQFMAKPQKMDLIVRQAVECGVATIVPVLGEYCQGFSSRQDRWERIIREAESQCGSSVQTKVESAMRLKDALSFWQQKKVCDDGKENLGVVLYERNNDTISIHDAVARVPNAKNVALAVGAEGGISPSEIEEIERAGFAKVHLITNILRCETAALYGIAALQVCLAEKDKWQFKE